MRKFGIVLKYELKEYFSSKGFMVLTFVIAFLGAALLFLPRFIDMSDFTGVQVVGEKEEPEEVTEEDMTKFAYIDLTENGVLQEELLQQMIPDVSWHKMNSLEELKQSLSVILAKAYCKRISREEIHQLVDQIYDETFEQS